MSQFYFTPTCSKCRTAQALLEEHHISVTTVRYLETPPTRPELEHLMDLLGIVDPRLMMRTGEAVYIELGLAQASSAELLDAITAHPVLLERPIFVHDERAIIGRPPERVLDLL